MSKIKLYISKQEDTISEDLLYADETKLVSWFEDTECEVETEDCELCLLEPLQTQKAIECLKEVKDLINKDFTIAEDYWKIRDIIDTKIKELEGADK